MNPQKQTLWEHSYGALFVLYTLGQQPQSFSHYIAADPALWWQQGLWLQHYEPLLHQQKFQKQTLWLLKSERREIKTARHTQQADRIAQHQRITHSLPPHTTEHLAQRLNVIANLTVFYRSYPQHTHGSLLSTTFLQALKGTQTSQGLTD